MTSPAPIRRWVLGLALSALAILPARSASPYTETFASGMNGWTNSAGSVWRTNTGPASIWGTNNATARVILPADLLTRSSTLTATGRLFTAAYTGNYSAAGISLIGFKISVENDLLQDLRLTVLSGTNGYFNSLASLVATTNTVYQFFFSLASKEAGAWSGSEDNLFSNVMQDVTRVDIFVRNATISRAATCRVDDIVVDGLQSVSSLVPSTNNQLLLAGTFLQSNVTYLVEATPELTGIWTAVQSVYATNRNQIITLTNNGPQLFWRLTIP